jgi:hypothetical protein
MKRFRLLLLLFAAHLLADEQDTHTLTLPTPGPWFTGPLLAPSGYTIGPGKWNVEPYLSLTVNTGRYNSHWNCYSTPNFYSTSIQVQAKVGLLPRLDFQFYPQAYYNETQGQHYTNIGDLPLGINIQLYRSELEDTWPAMKLALRVNTPIGKYQHLDPKKKNTDAMGAGSWLPAAGLIFSKLLHLDGIHYFEWRLACVYQIGTAIHVKGRNSYGGDHSTHGRAYPGNNLNIDGAIQYNFSQRWALACDLVYSHTNKNRFSGKTTASMTRPSNEQFSIAPALQYNWSKNIGLLAGSWFTFAGRNSIRFASGLVALNMYF